MQRASLFSDFIYLSIHLYAYLSVWLRFTPQPNPVNFAKLCEREKSGQRPRPFQPSRYRGSWLWLLGRFSGVLQELEWNRGCVFCFVRWLPSRVSTQTDNHAKGRNASLFTNGVCHRSKLESTRSVHPHAAIHSSRLARPSFLFFSFPFWIHQ